MKLILTTLTMIFSFGVNAQFTKTTAFHGFVIGQICNTKSAKLKLIESNNTNSTFNYMGSTKEFGYSTNDISFIIENQSSILKNITITIDRKTNYDIFKIVQHINKSFGKYVASGNLKQLNNYNGYIWSIPKYQGIVYLFEADNLLYIQFMG